MSSAPGASTAAAPVVRFGSQFVSAWTLLLVAVLVVGVLVPLAMLYVSERKRRA
jgi:hypothetical protein